jgi:hypothetical protein
MAQKYMIWLHCKSRRPFADPPSLRYGIGGPVPRGRALTRNQLTCYVLSQIITDAFMEMALPRLYMKHIHWNTHKYILLTPSISICLASIVLCHPRPIAVTDSYDIIFGNRVFRRRACLPPPQLSTRRPTNTPAGSRVSM